MSICPFLLSAGGRRRDRTAVTDYGIRIHASVEKNNVFACQFHPEKSSSTGLAILKNL